MGLELLPSSERNAASARWQALERQINNVTLKNSWLWIGTWLTYFGDDVPHEFAFAIRDGRTIGAALITQPKELFIIPRISVGTSGEPLGERTDVQYNQFLVEPSHMNLFAEDLMNYITQCKWSVLSLDGFTPEHADVLIQAGEKVGLDFTVRREPSPTFDFRHLKPDQEIWQGISHDQRSKIRRSMKLFNQIFGPRSVEWAETIDEAKDILHELITLHTKQWQRKGYPGCFYTGRLCDYHEGLVDALFPDRVIAFRVRQGMITIGCLFNLIEDRNGHVVNHRSGFLTFEDNRLNNRLKPGYVTNILFMEEARQRGYAEFDLLQGHREYKNHITNDTHTLIWANAGRGVGAKAYNTIRSISWRPSVRRIINGVILQKRW